MASIQSIIDAFVGDDELAHVQRELVATLGQYAQSRADVFKTQIRASLTSRDYKLIPITAIVEDTGPIYAYTSQSPDDIARVVLEVLVALVPAAPRDVVEGVSGVTTKKLVPFLTGASGPTSETGAYYVMTEGSSIVRLDYKAWYSNVTAPSVYEKIQRVAAFVGVKSTVDLRIDLHTLLSVYQFQLIDAGLSRDQIERALILAREIYMAFWGIVK